MNSRQKKVIAVAVSILIIAVSFGAVLSVNMKGNDVKDTPSNNVTYSVTIGTPKYASSEYTVDVIINITPSVNGHLFLKNGDDIAPIRHSNSGKGYNTSYDVKHIDHPYSTYYNYTTRTYSDAGQVSYSKFQFMDYGAYVIDWKDSTYQRYTVMNEIYNTHTLDYKDTNKSVNSTKYNGISYSLPFETIYVYEAVTGMERVCPYGTDFNNNMGLQPVFADRFCKITENVKDKLLIYTHTIYSETSEGANAQAVAYKEMLDKDVLPRLICLDEVHCDTYLAEQYESFDRKTVTYTH